MLCEVKQSTIDGTLKTQYLLNFVYNYNYNYQCLQKKKKNNECFVIVLFSYI
jgi:hypothetical protein